MGLIIASMVDLIHINRPIVRSFEKDIARDFKLNAALAEIVAHLEAPSLADRWRVDAEPIEWKFDNDFFEIRIQDAQGLIDINSVDNHFIERLLVSTGGLSQNEAELIANRIVDWRERDPLKRSRSSNIQDYLDAGLNYHPRGGPFLTVDEIKLVLGINQQIFERIEPALTVFSGLSNFDPNIAPLECLLSIPEIDRNIALEMIKKRKLIKINKDGFNFENGKIDNSNSINGHIFHLSIMINNIYNYKIIIRTINQKEIFWILFQKK